MQCLYSSGVTITAALHREHISVQRYMYRITRALCPDRGERARMRPDPTIKPRSSHMLGHLRRSVSIRRHYRPHSTLTMLGRALPSRAARMLSRTIVAILFRLSHVLIGCQPLSIGYQNP